MHLKLTSPAFQHGGDIPQKFTGEAENISPTLKWEETPAGTKSFALVMEDIDAPDGTLVHWTLWNIPPNANQLPENIPRNPTLGEGLVQGRNDFDKFGYSGPYPPRGSIHRYRFKFHALKTELNLAPGASGRDFAGAVRDQILSTAELVGKFQGTGISQAQKRREAKATHIGGMPSGAVAAREARMLALDKDPVYLRQSYKVRNGLVEAYATDQDTVEKFFRRFSMTSPFTMRKLHDFLKDIPSVSTRRALEDYVALANRFRVQFRMRPNTETKELEFRVLPWPSFGRNFHVKYVTAHREVTRWKKKEKGKQAKEIVTTRHVTEHLEPARRRVLPGDPYVESFSDDYLQAPEEIQELIDEGKATFVQIEDTEGYSILKDLESFAYQEDGVVIVQHNAEQPYFICIFGESAKKELLPQIGPALSEFQKKHFQRGHGGRTPKLDRLKKTIELEKEPTSAKTKAIELAGGDAGKFEQMNVYVSKFRRKIKDK